MNREPQITVPMNLGQQQQLKIISEVGNVTVVANDPENEVLSFVWLVPHGVPYEVTESQQVNGDYVSTLSVARDEALDGSVITCTVSDAAKPRNVVSIEWVVEVL